ncbi:MAG: Ig domain-containing protein [Gemmatimonadales bacterium]
MRVLRLGLVSAALAATLAGTARAQAAVAEVQVAPGVLTLKVGQGQRLHATAYDAGGSVIVNGVRYRWVSANVNVARVDSTGHVTAVAPGNALVRAEALGASPPKAGAATVTVRRP